MEPRKTVRTDITNITSHGTAESALSCIDSYRNIAGSFFGFIFSSFALPSPRSPHSSRPPLPNVIPQWPSGPARLCTYDRHLTSACAIRRLSAPACSSSISIRPLLQLLIAISVVAAVLPISWIPRLNPPFLPSPLTCVLRPIRPCLPLLFLRCARRADRG